NTDSATAAKWGITQPTAAPSVAVGAVTNTIFDTLRATTGWAASGTASGLSASTAGTFVNNILYDSGSTGWCSIELVAITNYYAEGRVIRVTNAVSTSEDVVVQRILKPVKNTTIAAITYDAGTTGLCTVVLTENSRKRLVKDSLLKLNTEVVRVLSVAIGDDDSHSFRCSTTSNHTVGQSVTGLTSIRIYTTLTLVGGGAATGDIVQPARLNFTAGAGLGFVSKAITLDLSQVSGREIQDTDELVFSIVLNNASLTT